MTTKQDEIPPFKEMFEYKNGELFWKIRPVSHFCDSRVCAMFNSRYFGKRAGHINKGYVEIFLNKKRIGVHRIVFAMFNGRIPTMVDHIDGDKQNNKIENLRECTESQNQHNRRIYANNTSGIKGVYWNKSANKWQVSIGINGILKHIGCFSSITDAANARRQAAEKYHGEFACHG